MLDDDTRTGEDRVEGLLTDAQCFAFGFFWVAWSGCLPAQNPEGPCLSARGLVPVRMLCLIRGLPIMGFPRHGSTQIHDLLRVGIDEEDVLSVWASSCRCSAPFVWCDLGRWAAFAPVNRQVGTAGASQITGRHTTGVALGGLPEGAQGLLQDWQEPMNPVVGSGLTQPKVQAVHRLQGVDLLIDQDEEELVFAFRQCPCGAAADLPLRVFPACSGQEDTFPDRPSETQARLFKLVHLSPVAARNSRV